MKDHLGLRILRIVLYLLALAALLGGVLLIVNLPARLVELFITESGLGAATDLLGLRLLDGLVVALSRIVERIAWVAGAVCGLVSVLLFALGEVMGAIVSVSDRVERLEQTRADPQAPAGQAQPPIV